MIKRIKLFFKVLRDYIRYSKNAELYGFAVGFNSFVNREKDMHILMLDYDVDDYKKVQYSVEEIQDQWNLSDAFIYSTKNGFHVLFYFDIMPYSRCRLIINYARSVDPLYKLISRFYDHKTLRTAGKYKKHDIKYHTYIPGRRKPTIEELELGDLKRNEHISLFGLHEMIAKNRLK